MKLSSLSVKRRPVKKGALRTLFANIPRKKVRAATAAATMPDVEGDVPNLGIARALVVILVIHVVAIAGIFAHSRWFEEKGADPALAASQAAVVPAKPLPDAGANLPKLSSDDTKYMATTGDTYEKIAAANGVTVDELRAANGNMELRGGRVLKIPPRTIIAEVPPELARLRGGPEVLEAPAEEVEAPVATTTRAERGDDLRSAEMIPTQAAASNAPQLIKPNVRRGEVVADAAPRATPVTTVSRTEDATPAPAAKKKYTVKSGDTFWRIAQAHKTTPAAIMKANRITDAKKLKAGMELLVP